MIKDKATISAFVAIVVLWMVTFGLAYTMLLPQDGPIILHQNAQGEVTSLGTAQNVVGFLLVFSVVLLINIALVGALYLKERLLAYFLAFATVWIAFVGAVAIYTITALN